MAIIKSFSCISPCKINEFLYITGKRNDGYHNLQTLFVVLNHGDPMSFDITDDGIVDLKTAFDFPKEQNLIYKAAMLLQERYAVKKGCLISIDKILPQGGGLGGGSANAATVLQVLSHFWGLKLNDETLIKLGATLGADVPLFIKGVTTFGEGIGELLTVVPWPERYYLVVNPNCKVPTKELFASPLLKRDSPQRSFEELLNAPFDNCFTPVVIKQYPQVEKLLEQLEKYGNARMSGSGSSCFVSFADEKSCNEALADFCKKFPNLPIFKAKSCANNYIKEALLKA